MDGFGFAPDFRLELDGEPAMTAVRAAVSAVRAETGMEGVDQAEVVLVNDGLRWLDDSQFSIGRGLALDLGYAAEDMVRVFNGEIVAKSADFSADLGATLTVTAQDRRHRMQDGTKARWFAIPIPMVGNFSLPDPVTVMLVTAENMMVPVLDPIGAALGIILGGVEAVAVVTDPDTAQKMIRKQADESDLDFLARVARENGWDMVVEHDGVLGGHLLRFQSSLDRLQPTFTYGWGRDLVEFHPRISKVGVLEGVSIAIWVPSIKMVFTVTLGFDWDRMAFTLAVYPGSIPLGLGQSGRMMIDEPASPFSAPRKLVSEFIPRLNRRLTATATVVGEPRLRAGEVLRIEGVGVEFGGLYRIAQVAHQLDGSGLRTKLELRKDVWFGSIPAAEQGAFPILPPRPS